MEFDKENHQELSTSLECPTGKENKVHRQDGTFKPNKQQYENKNFHKKLKANDKSDMNKKRN